MSKHETWRTRKYWEQTGGLLIEEFIVVNPSAERGTRLIDGVIIVGQQTQIHASKSFDIAGHDIICIQTKKSRLGMSVMGQAFFSRELLQKLNPASIKSVIICGQDDHVLRQLCNQYQIEVVVMADTLNQDAKTL